MFVFSFDNIDIFMPLYNDIVIFREYEEERLLHLDHVLYRLQQHQLYIGKSKFEVMNEHIELFCLRVSKNGI